MKPQQHLTPLSADTAARSTAAALSVIKEGFKNQNRGSSPACVTRGLPKRFEDTTFII